MRASSASTACSRSRSGTANRRRLFLARDRFGVKPLYWYLRNGLFVFASEIKAILAHPRVSRDVCYPALNEYFTFQNVLTDLTLFDGVRLLPAGCTLTLEVGDGAEPQDRALLGLPLPRGARRHLVRGGDRPALRALPRRGRRASSSATCRSAPTSAEAWTRARSRRSRPGAYLDSRPSPAASTSARRTGSSSPSTSARRPRRWRTGSRPSTTRS